MPQIEKIDMRGKGKQVFLYGLINSKFGMIFFYYGEWRWVNLPHYLPCKIISKQLIFHLFSIFLLSPNLETDSHLSDLFEFDLKVIMRG